MLAILWIRYLDHLRKRAAGEIMTTAAWLRHFVTSHPGYQKDSVVTDEIAYDLVVACQEIGLVRVFAGSGFGFVGGGGLWFGVFWW